MRRLRLHAAAFPPAAPPGIAGPAAPPSSTRLRQSASDHPRSSVLPDATASRRSSKSSQAGVPSWGCGSGTCRFPAIAPRSVTQHGWLDQHHGRVPSGGSSHTANALEGRTRPTTHPLLSTECNNDQRSTGLRVDLRVGKQRGSGPFGAPLERGGRPIYGTPRWWFPASPSRAWR